MGKRKSRAKAMKGPKKETPTQLEVFSNNGITRPEATDASVSRQQKNHVLQSEPKEAVEIHKRDSSEDDDFDYFKSPLLKNNKKDVKQSEQREIPVSRSKNSKEEGEQITKSDRSKLKARSVQSNTQRRAPATKTSNALGLTNESSNKLPVNNGHKRPHFPNVGPQQKKINKTHTSTAIPHPVVDLTQDDNRNWATSPIGIKRYRDGTLDSWLVRPEKKDKDITTMRRNAQLLSDENTIPRAEMSDRFSRKRGNPTVITKSQDYEKVKVQTNRPNPLTDISNQIRQNPVYDDKPKLQTFDPESGGLNDIITSDQIPHPKSKFTFKLKEAKSNSIATHDGPTIERVTATQTRTTVSEAIKYDVLSTEYNPSVESSSFTYTYFDNDHWHEISPQEAEQIEAFEAKHAWLREIFSDTGEDQNDGSDIIDVGHELSGHAANGSSGYNLLKSKSILPSKPSAEDVEYIPQAKKRAFKKHSNSSQTSVANKAVRNKIDTCSGDEETAANDPYLKKGCNRKYTPIKNTTEISHIQPSFETEDEYAGVSRSPVQSLNKTHSSQKRKSSTNIKASSTVTSYNKNSSHGNLEEQYSTDNSSAKDNDKNFDKFYKITDEDTKNDEKDLPGFGSLMEEPDSDFASSSGTDDELMSDCEQEVTMDSGENLLSTPTLDASSRSDSTVAQAKLPPNMNTSEIRAHTNCPHNPQHRNKKYDKYLKKCIDEKYTLQFRRTKAPRKGSNRGNQFFNLMTDGYIETQRTWGFKCKEVVFNGRHPNGIVNIRSMFTVLSERPDCPLHSEEITRMSKLISPYQRESVTRGVLEFYDADIPDTPDKWVAVGDTRKITKSSVEFELKFVGITHFDLLWTNVKRNQKRKYTMHAWLNVLEIQAKDNDKKHDARHMHERVIVESCQRGVGKTEYFENSAAAVELHIEGWKSTDHWFAIPNTGIQLLLKGLARGKEKLVYYVRGIKPRPGNEAISIKSLLKKIMQECLVRPIQYEITNTNGLSEFVIDKLRRGPSHMDGLKTIYILHNEKTQENIYKVGITVNLKDRLTKLKYLSGGIEHIIDQTYLTPYGFLTESIAHQILLENKFENVIPPGSKRNNGFTEWFKVSLQYANIIVKRAVDLVTSLHNDGTYTNKCN